VERNKKKVIIIIIIIGTGGSLIWGGERKPKLAVILRNQIPA
jgi:hypothetical protein